MARNDFNQGFLPSVWNRLIDPDSAGTAGRRGYGIDQMEQAVFRDLEDLLNTRQTGNDIPEDLTAVRDSIINYGFPDLTSLNVVSARQCEEIGRLLKSIIERFEPRLKDVQAIIRENADDKQGTVRFRIEAKLALDEAQDLLFDTVLELTTGHYSIKRNG